MQRSPAPARSPGSAPSGSAQTSGAARLYEVLESARPGDAASRLADLVVIGLISINTICIVLDSVPSLHARFGALFFGIEVGCVVFFTIEYALRIWSAGYAPSVRADRRLRERLRFACRPLPVFDLLAIAPFYLSAFVAVELPFMRVLRLLRVFKLARYSPAMKLVLEVYRAEARAFGSALFLMAVLMLFAASGMYLAEGEHQPEAFGSIPSAMWWALVTLTTVGYGDVTPTTPLGKIFGAGVTIVGVAMVALPAGLLASGFQEELRRRREEFGDCAEDALADGVIDRQEAATLEALRVELGVTTEEADRLLRACAEKWARETRSCPHCGEKLEP